MRVEIPMSVHGCYDVVHKCGTTYVISPHPLTVTNSTERFAPGQHVHVYTVPSPEVTINGTTVRAREYHVSTCKLAFTSMIKDSSRFIPAWCAYHQHIGADFFFLYDNGSSDEEFEALVEAAKPFPGIIFRWNYPFVYGGCTQAGQQTHSICLSKHSIQRLGLTDVDEYLVVESGTLNELITPPLVRIWWKWFGQNGQRSLDPRDYTRCKRLREGEWFCKAICDPLRCDHGLIHNAGGPGLVPYDSTAASFHHYRGLTNNSGRDCDMTNHADCPYCEVENTQLVQCWERRTGE